MVPKRCYATWCHRYTCQRGVLYGARKEIREIMAVEGGYISGSIFFSSRCKEYLL
jgi:hypothetical protein